MCVHACSGASVVSLCKPVDRSPPDSVHGIFKSRILQLIAISSSRVSS